MLKPLRLHLKKLLRKGALKSVLLLVFGVGIGLWTAGATPGVHEWKKEVVYRPIELPGMQEVIPTVGKTVVKYQGTRPQVQAVILPHHSTVASTMDRFWAELAQSAQPDTIVVVSPAHFEQGQALTQTTLGTWQTSFGNVVSDESLVRTLMRTSELALEPMSFEMEHGVGIHTPYIAHYFPQTPVAAVIAKSGAGKTAATKLVRALEEQDQSVLLVVSIDFAHYLPESTSLTHDQETWEAIVQQDLARIDQFGPEHVDSSFALDLFVLWQQMSGCRMNERWHEYNPAGTSYFVLMCVDEPHVRLSAVGDVMLARGVADRLSGKSLEDAIQLVQHVSAGSDMVFGNLESVVSDRGVPLEKPYVFRAHLSVLDVLKEFGFTHLSVANNHSEDYGEVAWQQSVQLLKENGIVPMGSYRNEPVITESVIGDVSIAALAFQSLTYPLNEQTVIDRVKEAKLTHDVVVVSLHWGEEYRLQPEPQTVSFAHALIDAGATVILGHHPHVLQPIEEYHDGLIVYSMGNFLFDQVGDEQTRSEIVTIDLFKDEPPRYTVTPVRIQNYLPKHVNFAQIP